MVIDRWRAGRQASSGCHARTQEYFCEWLYNVWVAGELGLYVVSSRQDGWIR